MVERTKLDEDLRGIPVNPTRYLGTINMGLWYSKDIKIALIAYANANYAWCQDTKRSTSALRSKHIDVKYHFIKEEVENGMVELYFIKTEYQLADLFTKALSWERFEFLLNQLKMKSMSLETLKSLAETDEE
nr:retrovirus-related Pol polyprotein from transposon TNT 1-94 [Tanacetum cinerariifolium]